LDLSEEVLNRSVQADKLGFFYSLELDQPVCCLVGFKKSLQSPLLSSTFVPKKTWDAGPRKLP
jgi:hypothetical protein